MARVLPILFFGLLFVLSGCSESSPPRVAEDKGETDKPTAEQLACDRFRELMEGSEGGTVDTAELRDGLVEVFELAEESDDAAVRDASEALAAEVFAPSIEGYDRARRRMQRACAEIEPVSGSAGA